MPDTSNLIRDIEKKDRRYRASQVIFNLLFALGFLGLYITQQSGVQQQLDQQRKATEELKQNTSQQLNLQTQYIRCLATYFSQTDRANLTITDIDKCLLNRADQPTTQSSTGAASTPTAGAPVQRTTPAASTQQTSSQPSGQSGGSAKPNPTFQLCVLGACLP